MSGKPTGEHPVSRFQEMGQQLLEFFNHEHQKRGLQSPASSEPLVTDRNLGCGLVLRATSDRLKIVSLQISYDPLRFKKWKEDLGPLELFYANPFGIEITYRHEKWGFFIEGEKLPVSSEDQEETPLAQFQITTEGTERVPFIKTTPAQLVLSSDSSREIPGEHRNLESGGDQVSRLLEVLGS